MEPTYTRLTTEVIQRLLLLCLLPLVASCSPLKTIEEDQVAVSLQLVRWDKESKILAQVWNRTNTTWSKVIVLYELRGQKGESGQQGLVLPLTSPLEPNQVVSTEVEVDIPKGLELAGWKVATERPLLRLVKIVVIGFLMAGGVVVQLKFIVNGAIPTESRRVQVAAVVAAIFLIGIAFDSLFGVLASQNSWRTFAAESGAGLLFSLSLIICAYLSILTAAFVLSSCAYFLLTYGGLHKIPIVQTGFDAVFPNSPNWLSAAFTIVVLIFLISTAWAEE